MKTKNTRSTEVNTTASQEKAPASNAGTSTNTADKMVIHQMPRTLEETLMLAVAFAMNSKHYFYTNADGHLQFVGVKEIVADKETYINKIKPMGVSHAYFGNAYTADRLDILWDGTSEVVGISERMHAAMYLANDESYLDAYVYVERGQRVVTASEHEVFLKAEVEADIKAKAKAEKKHLKKQAKKAAKEAAEAAALNEQIASMIKEKMANMSSEELMEAVVKKEEEEVLGQEIGEEVIPTVNSK